MAKVLQGWIHSVLFLCCRLGVDFVALLFLLTLELPLRYLRTLTTTTPKSSRFENILITGASSGIGAQLAKSYAKPGRTLGLLSYRDSENLRQVAEVCREQGAEVVEFDENIANEEGMQNLLLQFDADHPLDLVVANAGIAAREDGLKESRNVIKVNVLGSLNTVLPALECMRPRKKGQLALVSSLGGYATPSNKFMLPYLASKHAVRIYGEGLRAALKEDGIGVTVVYPGFTKSKMTEKLADRGVKFGSLFSEKRAGENATNIGEKLKGMSFKNNRVVKLIKAAIDANASDVYFPQGLYMLTRVFGNLPTWATERMMPLIMNGDPFRPMDFVKS